ncbi:MAG: hypothetical protein K2X72_13790, partial [Reyranella sp.]|nr:hypothetical protein [Reyranella sp.]
KHKTQRKTSFKARSQPLFSLSRQKLVKGPDGQWRVDVRKTDPRAPHVGKWAETDKGTVLQETGKFMVTISKYPGMNAMGLWHDHVSYTLALDPVTNVLSIVPATIATYYGTGAPAEDQIRKSAQESNSNQK